MKTLICDYHFIEKIQIIFNNWMIQDHQILVLKVLKKRYLIVTSTIWTLEYHLQKPCQSGDL